MALRFPRPQIWIRPKPALGALLAAPALGALLLGAVLLGAVCAAAAPPALPPSAPEVSEDGLLPVTLLLRVAPYGTVFVDGQKVAANAKRVRVFVPPGQHSVVVTNPYALEHRQSIFVAYQEAPTDVLIRLLPKPASLVVDADLELTAFVGGQLIGTLTPADKKPLRIPMQEWTGNSVALIRFETRDGRQAQIPFRGAAGSQATLKIDFSKIPVAVAPLPRAKAPSPLPAAPRHASQMAW